MYKPDTSIAADSASDFDFDTWSTLFEQDPDAFEQRRRELLQAELGKADRSQREHLAALLDAYDERVKDLPTPERLQVAGEFAFGSLARLQDALVTLADTLSPAQAGDEAASQSVSHPNSDTVNEADRQSAAGPQSAENPVSATRRIAEGAPARPAARRLSLH